MYIYIYIFFFKFISARINHLRVRLLRLFVIYLYSAYNVATRYEQKIELYKNAKGTMHHSHTIRQGRAIRDIY